MTTIGFIGLGAIGAPMATQIAKAGHRLLVHDLRRAAAEPLLAEGAQWVGSARELAEECRVVLTSLPGPPQVEAVVCGPDGLLAGARDGDVHADLTTNSLEMAQKIAAIETEKGIQYLDAPVSGGGMLASVGAVSVMASGPRAAFDAARPAFEAIGDPEKIFHISDEVGAGTLVKLINNAIFLVSGVVAQEALVLGAKGGIETGELLKVLQASSASMYLGLAGMFAQRDFDNAFFTLDLATKDLSLALESAKGLGVDLSVMAAARDLYARTQADGHGDKVFFSTLRTLEETAATEVAPPRE